MVKLIGKKNKIAVFISGRGSNLKSLIKFSKKNSTFEISFVVSDNKNATGLNFTKINKIQQLVINFKNKKLAEKKILKYLNKKKIKFIALAGFMKILSKSFIKNFNGTILNIHPSLLPKYKGLNTHKRVLKNKEIYSGCTVHLVTEKLDSGKILAQKKVRVLKNDNEISLSKKILKQEHLLYPKTIEKILTNL
tara:strand:+ start:1260 stop:1838 length:579 start_codon:yes stop_codon:yes gene_type:complete